MRKIMYKEQPRRDTINMVGDYIKCREFNQIRKFQETYINPK